MCYLPFEVFSVSFSNKLAATKLTASITVTVCIKNILRLYFPRIVVELVTLNNL